MSVYSLQSDDLENLGPYRAVLFFRKLLWAEASRNGVGRHLIHAPDCINVGDGGLDAVIEDATPTSEEVIPSGISGFQVKSSNLSPSKCKKELHQNGDLLSPLKDGIKRVLDSNGAYVLVLFAEISQKKRREEAIKEELCRMNYPNARVRVYTANQIISFAERFPTLAFWLKPQLAGCLLYETWAGNGDVKSPKAFVADEDRRRIIEEIRKRLRNAKDTTSIFRVVGLSGLGKTRLVFEALSTDDLKNKVLYMTETLKNHGLLETLLGDSNSNAIVVVDDCSLENHDRLARYFSNRGSRLALITISNEMSSFGPPTFYYQLKPLPQDEVKQLLSQEFKGLPDNVIDRLAYFAEGYPRIAIILAENYRSGSSSQTDILNVNDDTLMNRLIAERPDPSSEWFRKTKKVLMGLSLFEKVGYVEHLSSEAQWLANFVIVSWDEFQQIVREQKQRGIIHGDYYLYVTPFRLIVYLVREWWDTYGKNIDFAKLFQEMPKESRIDMFNRFSSHFPFITPTEAGRELVKNLLSKDGPFADGLFLKTEVGANLFMKLAEADPESALDCLRRTIGTWNKQQVLEFETGRRQIVWSLEKMAVWKEFFADSARLLLALGEAENENYSNNASGVFAGLFSPAWGIVAPTEASPEERFPILVEAVNSESIERKRLALKAFKHALQTGHFSRMISAEYQGGRPIPKLWTPKTKDELLNHYRRIWAYLEENLDKYDIETRERVVEIHAQSARDMNMAHPSLSEMARISIKRMSLYSWINRSKLLEAVSKIVHYDSKKMSEDTLKDWIALRDELTGSSFGDLLKRYAGMDLLEDYFQTGKNYDTNWVNSKLQELAKMAIENPDLLEAEYSWLITKQARRGSQFGYELGKIDKEFLLLEKLVEKQKDAGSTGSINFLGGYFRALFERRISLWEDKLDSLSKLDSFKRLIPELTWRSGMTDKAAKRILLLLEKGDVEIDNLWIFGFGTVVKQISEPVFVDWAKFLVKEQSGKGAVILLHLIHSYYVYEENKTLPEDLTRDLLLHTVFLNNPNDVPLDQMIGYYWKEIALRLINSFPETRITIAEQIIRFFGERRSITSSFRSETHEVLLEITKQKPDNLWITITEHLGPPIKKETFYLKQWLRGRNFETKHGALELFNPENIWKWVDQDVDNRARYLATFVPPSLFHSAEKVCLARELLVRYGDREDVREGFHANYFTEGWMGPASLHYINRKKELLELQENETNGNVIKWIEECIGVLEKRIHRAKINEEKEFSRSVQ